MRGYFGEDRCCTKKQNMRNALDMGVKCACMCDVLPEDNFRNGIWFACEDGVYPT
jgi:hypothetical protein